MKSFQTVIIAAIVAASAAQTLYPTSSDTEQPSLSPTQTFTKSPKPTYRPTETDAVSINPFCLSCSSWRCERRATLIRLYISCPVLHLPTQQLPLTYYFIFHSLYLGISPTLFVSLLSFPHTQSSP
jgi:hypothetical protein